MTGRDVTLALAREFGLSAEEYGRVLAIMGRTPSLTELGIFSVMWSEHCSYKSSRVHLRELPTSSPWVINGPGENAGVVAIGDGLAAVFKMESHNHPSFIEPYQGAATGVGGYGNCVGVPTVGGEVNFHRAYNGNPLVNAMTVGIAPLDRIFLSAAAGIGNPVIYVGAKTGRAGIHGATMASAEFATDAIVAIQDMGAAGLTSSSVEMAGKGGVGLLLDLDAVPQREPGMSAYEMMLSESQERMLMVLRPDRQDMARAIFEKWELDFAVIGRLTDTGRIVVTHQGRTEADIELAPLADQAPVYHRPVAATPKPAVLGPVPDPVGIGPALLTLVGCPDLCSRAWVWNQYDSTVGGQTVRRPGTADAAVVKLEGLARGLALTTDCTPRYCAADAEAGGLPAVAEAWRNLTAVGARPLAVTDNMNFGNPEKPEVMGQFAASIAGMAAACTALDFPVVSGNVSLYNETEGRAILPTPAIGGLGVLDDVALATAVAVPPGLDLVLIGETQGWLGQSLWLREVGGREDGAPPPVDLAAERRHGDFVRARILAGTVAACHDVSDGGLLVALAEMALAGNAGIELSARGDHAFWFGEDQARYVLAVRDSGELLAQGVPALRLGRSVAAPHLTLPDGTTISIAALRAAHEAFFPAWMDQPSS